MREKINMYISRIADDGQEQLTSNHLTETAYYAAALGSKLYASSLAFIAALFHDMGKFSLAFVEYLLLSVEGKKMGTAPRRGSVIHSTQGAKYISDLVLGKEEIYLAVAEIVANCIAGHHGGMTDGISPQGDTPLRNRLASDKDALHFDEVLENFQNANILSDGNNIAELLSACRKELDEFIRACKTEKIDGAFMVHMLVKSVFSCLVDADRYNAYCFDVGITVEAQTLTPSWDEYSERFEAYLSMFSVDSDIARIRHDVSEKCYLAAKRNRGIYQLKVPTGGGKTFSSLRFALGHAKEHSMNRIIYVIPYLSILEQTAKEIKKALSYVDSDDFILEHHSNLVPPDDEKEAQTHRLLTSRWNQPIVITTMVQFLESIFSHKSGDLRKFHNMANSVIVFDEVQSLPVKCVHLFNGAMNYLRVFGGCTALLCTATQPLLDKVPRPIQLSEQAELIPDTSDVFAKLKRTYIVDSTIRGGYSYGALSDFAIEKLNDAGNCLVILNTKKDVAQLFELIKAYVNRNPDCEIKLVHLSTSMCPAHRLAVIDSLQVVDGDKKKLKSERILCISTQLIEAGVDISFGCVIRALAGLDSIAQAAGRCNRNGEDPNGRGVYIVNLSEEKLRKLPDIKCGSEVSAGILDDSPDDFLSNAVMERYYAEYYYKREGEMDYKTSNDGTLYDLLSNNRIGKNAYTNLGGKTPPKLCQAFQTAGENFYMIDRGTIGVLVPYERGVKLADEYTIATFRDKPKLLREMAMYSVSLYARQVNKLKDAGALFTIGDDVLALRQEFYDAERGVVYEGDMDFLES
jgi:CRISPR-associated endonuclease/helicase Cas3